MTTEKDQPADEESGLNDDLGKVFDEVTKEAEPTEEAPEVEKAETKTEEPEAEKAPPEPETTEEPVTEETQETPSTEVVPPATWTAEAKEKFSNMDPILQNEVLKREKDFAQGVQKYAEAAKQGESYEQVVAPYRAMLNSTGASPQQAFANFLNIEYQLRSGNPQQRADLILKIAQNYGAELSQANSSTDEEDYIDPEIKGLKDEISSLKQTSQSQIQQAQFQQLQSLQKQIDDFQADQNEDGTLKYPHFDKVRSSMSALMTSGASQTLEDAYQQSLYLVPELREEIIQKQVKDAEAERIRKDTEAAEKAKKAAGLQLKNEEAGTVPVNEGTMKEELAAIYDKASTS